MFFHLINSGIDLGRQIVSNDTGSRLSVPWELQRLCWLFL